MRSIRRLIPRVMVTIGFLAIPIGALASEAPAGATSYCGGNNSLMLNSCIGSATAFGSVYLDAETYNNHSSQNYFGHTQFSTGSGTTIANTSDHWLNAGTSDYTSNIAVNYSGTWCSTFWQRNLDGSYSKLSSTCKTL